MVSTPTPLAKPDPDSNCPCGSGKTYRVCCGAVLSKERIAASAEEVMRARFTAHATADYGYLHRTYLHTADKPYVESGGSLGVTWTRLVVHSHETGSAPDIAHVDFSAYFIEEGQEGVLHEKAEFVRQRGDWIYSRAVREGPAPVRSAPKVGRNDPCPCGSGKKYKHCCLK